MKKPVTQRAIQARINRKLPKHQKLVRTSPADRDQFGEYHLTDEAAGTVKPVELEQLSLELGVLKPFEEVKDER